MYYYVYAFVLTGEKYYITHSVTELEKPCTFFSLSEDVWLQKYPIRDIDYHVRTSDIYDIDKLVVQYMDRYGAYNVRGGSFSFDALRSGTLYPFLATMSKRSTGCFLCGSDVHRLDDCDVYNSDDDDSDYVPPSEEEDDEDIDDDNSTGNDDDNESVR